MSGQTSKLRIAMLIDADNTPSDRIEAVLNELAGYGTINVRRAYGNWKSDYLKNWESCLHEYAIQPIQQFALIKGKNATDMAVAIDAMDFLYGGKVDAFALVSSDCDFTPLVMRLRAEGLFVLGFGRRQTPDAFTHACNEFLYLEQLESTATETQETGNGYKQKTGNELKGDTRLMNLLRKAIEAAKDESGWSSLGAVGSLIKNQGPFDPRNYGYKKLGDLVRAIDLLETKGGNGTAVFIRNRRH
ncbi:MAG: NYN domain-containing protein [Marinospirillum sp.]|uniref:NYN domain-containing protein n=1 Tax=Marinospirillum sp. TaxID=2183934 RepID=UPI0019E8D89E|nr:NYN domain-containing protein [Marinospirillum sp.]MBE0508640.1 NYN domain-containing protein [Marinospirillum sp.]